MALVKSRATYTATKDVALAGTKVATFDIRDFKFSVTDTSSSGGNLDYSCTLRDQAGAFGSGTALSTATVSTPSGQLSGSITSAQPVFGTVELTSVAAGDYYLHCEVHDETTPTLVATAISSAITVVAPTITPSTDTISNGATQSVTCTSALANPTFSLSGTCAASSVIDDGNGVFSFPAPASSSCTATCNAAETIHGTPKSESTSSVIFTKEAAAPVSSLSVSSQFPDGMRQVTCDLDFASVAGGRPSGSQYTFSVTTTSGGGAISNCDEDPSGISTTCTFTPPTLALGATDTSVVQCFATRDGVTPGSSGSQSTTDSESIFTTGPTPGTNTAPSIDGAIEGVARNVVDLEFTYDSATASNYYQLRCAIKNASGTSPSYMAVSTAYPSSGTMDSNIVQAPASAPLTTPPMAIYRTLAETDLTSGSKYCYICDVYTGAVSDSLSNTGDTYDGCAAYPIDTDGVWTFGA